ncbi:MAG: hypothetical protein E6246_05355 [Veillonella sp.]|nr:hypothetical protein [Veillonella sp.]
MFTSKYKDNSEKSTGLLFMRVYNKWHFTIKQAVPLVEEIDEIFFGKLKSDEAQFKHLLGRLHEA